jgi:predicted nucleotidyltransferase
MNDERMKQSTPALSVSEESIREIVRRILAVSRPDRVILFGSAASGQMTPDSDIDLLVLDWEGVDAREEALCIRRALSGLPFPFDVIVMSRERFEETRGVIGGIAWPAARYGRVIYEAA